MTSSGRRVKKRNLEWSEVDTVGSNRSVKHRNGKKKKKSSKSKGVRPRRKAARNALTLFSRITGASTDGEEEDYSSGSYSSESESGGLDSLLQSEDSDESLQHEQTKLLKGKEIVTMDRSEDAIMGQQESSDILVKPGNRRRLILKLPFRDSNKQIPPEPVNHESPLEVQDSRKDPMEGQLNGASCSSVQIREREHVEKAKAENCLDWTKGYTNGKIKWGGVKARSMKRPRIAEAASLVPYAESSLLSGGNDVREHKMSGLLKLEGSSKLQDNGMYELNKLQEDVGVLEGEIPPSTPLDEVNNSVKVPSASHGDKVDSADPSQQEVENFVGGCGNGPVDNTLCRSPLGTVQNQTAEMAGPDGQKRISTNNGDGGAQDLETNPITLPMHQEPNSHNKPYAVYRRVKLNRTKSNNTNGDGGRVEESTSVTNNESNTSAELDSREGSPNGASRTRSMEVKFVISDPGALNGGSGNEAEAYQCRVSKLRRNGLPKQDWGSSSKATVGLRSTRNRRASYHLQDAGSPIEKRKPNHQSLRKGSWLLLPSHEEGSRYIPQEGDEVVYLRQVRNPD